MWIHLSNGSLAHFSLDQVPQNQLLLLLERNTFERFITFSWSARHH